MYYSLYNYYIYIGLVNFHGKTIMIVSLLVPFVSSFIQPKNKTKIIICLVGSGLEREMVSNSTTARSTGSNHSSSLESGGGTDFME